MDKEFPNFKHMDAQKAKVYGKYDNVTCINPYRCHFMAIYPDGKIIQGKNFIDTGWDNIQNGISQLTYNLSTGHIINIPKFKA